MTLRASPIRSVLLVSALLAVGGAAAAQQGVAKTVDETESIVVKWYEVEDLISKEREAWRVEKQLIQDLIEIRTAELEVVEQQIDEFRKGTEAASKRRDELDAKKAVLESATVALEQKVRGMELRTLELLKQLPDVVTEKVATTSQALPAADATDEDIAKLSLDRRIINVLGTLQEIHRFQREVTVRTETRVLPGAKEGEQESAKVTAIYLGIGQAYYVNDKGDRAGFGVPDGGRWTWVPKNDYAEQIAKAIAIARSEAPAAFVPLPVKVR